MGAVQTFLRRGCLPIYLSRSEVDLYYNGYCNNILWPLFHYVPLSFESKLSETKNMGLQWSAYQEANELFARVIVNAYQHGDVVRIKRGRGRRKRKRDWI